MPLLGLVVLTIFQRLLSQQAGRWYVHVSRQPLLPLADEERLEWLAAYQQTYLERDLADLATLADLLPFRALQRLAMLRTGCLVSYADLARDAGVAASTARRYLEYLRLSYQAVLLPPFHTNLTSRLVKAPKIFWVDLGLLRHTTRQWGQLGGEMFETLAKETINILMISTSEIKVSCVIEEKYTELAVRVLHKAFDLEIEPTGGQS